MINVSLVPKEGQQSHFHPVRGACRHAMRVGGRHAMRVGGRHAMRVGGRHAIGEGLAAGDVREPRAAGSNREDDFAEEVAGDHRADSLGGQGQRQGPVDQRADPGLLTEPGQPG